jgi:hypothetical protein
MVSPGQKIMEKQVEALCHILMVLRVIYATCAKRCPEWARIFASV